MCHFNLYLYALRRRILSFQFTHVHCICDNYGDDLTNCIIRWNRVNAMNRNEIEDDEDDVPQYAHSLHDENASKPKDLGRIKWGTAAFGCECGQCNVYIVAEPVLHTRAHTHAFECYLHCRNEYFFFFLRRKTSIQRRLAVCSRKHSMKSKEEKRKNS